MNYRIGQPLSNESNFEANQITSSWNEELQHIRRWSLPLGAGVGALGGVGLILKLGGSLSAPGEALILGTGAIVGITIGEEAPPIVHQMGVL